MADSPQYHLCDPTGNITAIISSPVDVGSRREAAAKVMELEPACEQAGFLLPGDGIFDGSLRMAGGEFCGNASMSAAALLCREQGLQPEEKKSMVLRVSGAPDPVFVEIKALADGSYHGRVSMPQAVEISEILVPEEDELAFPLVIMPGIAHAIAPESFGLEEAEALLPAMCAQLGADAMGIMLLDDDFTRITPVVYVPGSRTLVREHSCASGTAAVGAYIAALTGEKITMTFQEPGGSLTVEADSSGEIFLEGNVKIIK